MTLRDMDEDEVGHDPMLARMRQCGRCGEGIMTARSLVELRVNQGYAGREYVFQCEECGHQVNDFNIARVLYQLMLLPLAGGFGAFLLYFGIDMAIDTAMHGPGGNDVSALVVVLVLFLGGGGVLTLLALGMTWSLLQDWNTRRKSPLLMRG